MFVILKGVLANDGVKHRLHSLWGYFCLLDFLLFFFWAYNKWWCLSCLALSQQKEYSLLTHEKYPLSFCVPWVCFCWFFPLPLYILLSASTSTMFDIIFKKFLFNMSSHTFKNALLETIKLKNLIVYTGKRAIVVGVLHPFLLLTFLLGKQTKKIDHLHLFWVSLFCLLVFQE